MTQSGQKIASISTYSLSAYEMTLSIDSYYGHDYAALNFERENRPLEMITSQPFKVTTV